MLGAGITSVRVGQLPAVVSLTLAARFYWDADEVGSAQLVAIRVQHEDGEPLVDYTVPVTPIVPPEGAPLEGYEQRVVLPLPLDLRREGNYFVRLLVNAEAVHAIPLRVQTEMPPV